MIIGLLIENRDSDYGVRGRPPQVGMSLLAAAFSAAKARLRPILMTV